MGSPVHQENQERRFAFLFNIELWHSLLNHLLCLSFILPAIFDDSEPPDPVLLGLVILAYYVIYKAASFASSLCLRLVRRLFGINPNNNQPGRRATAEHD